jgi:SAM-dependent methyltransferase
MSEAQAFNTASSHLRPAAACLDSTTPEGGPDQAASIFRPCPLCGQRDAEPYLTAGDTVFGFSGVFHVVRCRGCTMLWTNPQVAPEHLGAFYPRDYSAHAPDRAEKHQARPRSPDPWDRLPEVGRRRLLDVGCGSGAYILRQQRRGWQVWGVEPSDSAVLAAKDHGLRVVQGVIPGAVLPEEEFEAITMLGVLDHVPEPLTTLLTLRERLADEGVLIASVPNAASAAAGVFGADWPGWDLPRHQNHFTPDTLVEMLHRAGFARTEVYWKRRTSRWRQGARSRTAARGGIFWRLMAGSRNLCGLAARILSRGGRSDEMVVVAGIG